MGRFDTRMHAPPVRIARAQARVQQGQMARAGAVTRLAGAAGNFGAREVRFASVPMRLRIQSKAGPNTPAAQSQVKPIGVTWRKRGYPPVVTLPGVPS